MAESSRFQHLLQPIRDLSKNWNIDLAQELEEYLEELEHLTIAFDPNDSSSGSNGALFTGNASSIGSSAGAGAGRQVMNFAEAALLIQGSSVIYSRKVEYLYALVFQTLAHLSKQQEDVSQAQARQRARVVGTGEDDDGSENEQDGIDEEDHLGLLANPLPVYDRLEEAKNITMRSATSQAGGTGSTPARNAKSVLLRTKQNLQASIALMGSLVPDERDHGDTFKLMSCHLHQSGVLLMDEASRKYLSADSAIEESEIERQRRRSSVGLSLSGSQINFDGTGMFAGDGKRDVDDDDDSHDHDDHGIEFGGAEESEDVLMESEPLNDEADVAPPPADLNEPFGDVVPLPQVDEAITEEKDPWAPLDPYDASKAIVRPFRKGRSYPLRLPYKSSINLKRNKARKNQEEEDMYGIDDPKFKEKFFFSPNRPQWTSWVWNETDEEALEKKFSGKFGKAPLLMQHFADLWKLETKWSSLMRRLEAKETNSARAVLLQEAAAEEEEQMNAMHRSMLPDEAVHLGLGNSDTAESGAANVDTSTHGENDGDGDDGDDLDDGFEVAGDDGWRGDNEDGQFSTSSAPLTYEEICRQHIQEFMKGTEKYVRETDLSKQVNEWQSKLAPILKEQDAHPPFDIHRCGQSIIELLEENGEDESASFSKPTSKKSVEQTPPVVPFEEIVSGMNHYEVCRMFLASLQLANNGNVQLLHGKAASEQANVPFQMQLLSSSNVYESLQSQA